MNNFHSLPVVTFGYLDFFNGHATKLVFCWISIGCFLENISVICELLIDRNDGTTT